MPLTALWCDPKVAASPANREILRRLKTLKRINELPVAEFWKQIDAGKLPQSRGEGGEN
jgi:hypothetical protein